MNNKVFAVVSGCVFFGLAFVGTVGAASGPSATFNYETATQSEQKAWLEKAARPFSRGLKSSLPNGWGLAPKMELGKTIVSTKNRTITAYVKIIGPSRRVSGGSKMERAQMKQICPKFVTDPLYKNGVTLRTILTYENGARAHQLDISPAKCDRVMKGLI